MPMDLENERWFFAAGCLIYRINRHLSLLVIIAAFNFFKNNVLPIKSVSAY